MDEFAALLRSRLSARGDLARLAELSGITSHVLGRWRDGVGRPTDTNLRKLAPALGVPYEDLAKMCGYLPGQASSDINPQLAAFLAAVEVGWLSMDEAARDLAERGTRALFAVPSTVRGVANRHRDGASIPHADRRRALDSQRRASDESADQGGLSTVYARLSAPFGSLLDTLKRPLLPATAASAANRAVVG